MTDQPVAVLPIGEDFPWLTFIREVFAFISKCIGGNATPEELVAEVEKQPNLIRFASRMTLWRMGYRPRDARKQLPECVRYIRWEWATMDKDEKVAFCRGGLDELGALHDSTDFESNMMWRADDE